MSIRGRLNQMQGRANALMAKAEWTLDDAKQALAMSMELIEMVKDGVALGARLGPVDDLQVDSIVGLFQKVMREGIDVPVKLTLDLEYSNLPKAKCQFDGGPYDGKEFKLSDEQRRHRTILLKGGEAYAWNGYEFEYDGHVDELTG